MLANTSGFVYYVSITGITGAATPDHDAAVGEAVARIKRHTDLPVAVGFGIKTADAGARRSAAIADGVVVGSALVDAVRQPRSTATARRRRATVAAVADAGRRIWRRACGARGRRRRDAMPRRRSVMART